MADINWDAQPLGQVNDRQLANQLGVGHWVVRYHRQQRRISPVAKASYTTPTLTDWDAQPLGQVPDDVIAGRLGCSISNVARQRNRRGIPPVGSRTGGARWDRVRRDLEALTCSCGQSRFYPSCGIVTLQLVHVLCPACGNYVTTLVVAADVAT